MANGSGEHMPKKTWRGMHKVKMFIGSYMFHCLPHHHLNPKKCSPNAKLKFTTHVRHDFTSYILIFILRLRFPPVLEFGFTMRNEPKAFVLRCSPPPPPLTSHATCVLIKSEV